KPERGKEFEGGLDAGFFSDRAGIELTYYDKRTSDLLLVVPIAPSLGYQSSPFANIGKVRNRGLEFTVRATPVNRDNVQWDANFTGASLQNELLDLGTLQPIVRSSNGIDQRFVVGKPLNAWYTRRIRRIEGGKAIVSDTAEFDGS